MEVKKNGTQPSQKGPEEYSPATSASDPLNQAPEPAPVSCALVTFEPGARSVWHWHPIGQTLIVTQGCGWVQSEGGPKVEIRAGDVVSCPPKERHWHGAMSTTAMSHIAIQEPLDGKARSSGWRRSQTSNTKVELMFLKKRLTFLALALVMCLNQIACGAGKSTVGSTPPAQTSEVANKKAEDMK